MNPRDRDRTVDVESLEQRRMDHAEAGQLHLGSQPQGGRLAGVIDIAGFAHNLQVVDRRTGYAQQFQAGRLGVEGIETLRLAALPATRRALTGEDQHQCRMLAIGQIAAAQFEQPDRAGTAIHVAAHCGEQAGQQRGPHHLHVFTDRVLQYPIAAANGLGLALGNERPGDRFVQAQRGSCAADPAFEQLLGSRGRPGHAIGAWQGHAGDVVQPVNPDDFFDQVRAAVDIGAPGRHLNPPGLAALTDLDPVGVESQRGQDADLLVLGNRHTAQSFDQRRFIGNLFDPGWRRAGANDLARLAAADLDDQLGQQGQAGIEEGRIDPAFEPLAGI